MNTPKEYLSVSTFTDLDGGQEQRWRMIVQGLPICADKTTRCEVHRVWCDYWEAKGHPSTNGHDYGPIAAVWDGDKGEFTVDD